MTNEKEASVVSSAFGLVKSLLLRRWS